VWSIDCSDPFQALIGSIEGPGSSNRIDRIGTEQTADSVDQASYQVSVERAPPIRYHTSKHFPMARSTYPKILRLDDTMYTVQLRNRLRLSHMINIPDTSHLQISWNDVYKWADVTFNRILKQLSVIVVLSFKDVISYSRASPTGFACPISLNETGRRVDGPVSLGYIFSGTALIVCWIALF
jgi:hypothetical protein